MKTNVKFHLEKKTTRTRTPIVPGGDDGSPKLVKIWRTVRKYAPSSVSFNEKAQPMLKWKITW